MASFQKYMTNKGERWKFTIEDGIDPITGKRRRMTKRGFLKKRDASEAAKTLEYTLSVLNHQVKKQITFQDISKEWLNSYSINGAKISTVRVRLHELGHLNQYFQRLKIVDISKVKYQAALTDLKFNKGLAYNTISGIHGTARMIFKYSMKQDIIIKDPSEFAFIPKDKVTVEDIENTEIKDLFLEKEELQLFLNAAEKMNQESYVMLHTLAWTGLRAGELLALKWSDINFEKQTLSVTKTYYNPKNNTKKFELLPPKTKGSIRVIDIEEDVLEVLRRHKAIQSTIKFQLGKEYYDENFVFGRLLAPYFGYPHFIKTVENRFAAVLKKCETIKKYLTPHSLRHTHTSLMAEAGVELPQIMDRLGHTNDATTTQVYLHITKNRKKEASQKFGELMKSLSKSSTI
ncbi:MAG: tyrosine-type recombinase/integrase [Paenisporosarcina sp.]